MFSKILIANRGEIACRVAATARRMGIRTVAVYSDADACAAHVQACDEAVHIGGSAPADSYLRWEAILQAAKETGAQAIHPGYGFLSENAAFAQACLAAGVVFIGPSASSIEAMGLKAESKRLMESAGVPLVPGYHGKNQEPKFLQSQADNIGYPVLIKASAGGGGKGMRVVNAPTDFNAALASCQREASKSFGDDAVLIEKYVQRPRHIEIQVFGDQHGNVIHLYERDCSVQRRHQKVLEEAPAPGMPEALREAMGAAAIAAAKAVNYVGAGTVEFIVEQTAYDSPETMKFYFMEMNTRLQVEHPVTEAITGLDLVEWQLRVASGERLPMQQSDVQVKGHAIEARICAENPDQQFLPAIGRLHRLSPPPSSAFDRAPVRWDAGVREGDEISPFYDSMVAKLIVHGADRTEALAKLDAALALTRIVGVHTNVQFLRRLIRTPSFQLPTLDTALIEREAAQLFGQPSLPLQVVWGAAVLHQLAQVTEREGVDPWSRADHWVGFGVRQQWFEVKCGDVLHRLELRVARDGELRLFADDDARGWLLRDWRRDQRGDIQVGNWRGRVDVEVVGAQCHVFTREGAASLTWVDPMDRASDDDAGGGHLKAPMPGKVLRVDVVPGDVVKKGQLLAVLEAMKMEHSIVASKDGVIGEVMIAPGDQVGDGAELLTMAD